MKAGGPHTIQSDSNGGTVNIPILNVKREVKIQANINDDILKVPACGVCKLRVKKTQKLCVHRREVRDKLFEEEAARLEQLGGVDEPATKSIFDMVEKKKEVSSG